MIIWNLLLQCKAIVDQLEGDEEAHGKFRHLAVDYMQVFCKGSDLCTSRTSKIISRLLIVKMRKNIQPENRSMDM